jgi:hypothetical protein
MRQRPGWPDSTSDRSRSGCRIAMPRSRPTRRRSQWPHSGAAPTPPPTGGDGSPKSSTTSRRPRSATQCYAVLVTGYPSSGFVADASLRGALASLETGNQAAALAQLAVIADGDASNAAAAARWYDRIAGSDVRIEASAPLRERGRSSVADGNHGDHRTCCVRRSAGRAAPEGHR